MKFPSYTEFTWFYLKSGILWQRIFQSRLVSVSGFLQRRWLHTESGNRSLDDSTTVWEFLEEFLIWKKTEGGLCYELEINANTGNVMKFKNLVVHCPGMRNVKFWFPSDSKTSRIIRLSAYVELFMHRTWIVIWVDPKSKVRWVDSLLMPPFLLLCKVISICVQAFVKLRKQ